MPITEEEEEEEEEGLPICTANHIMEVEEGVVV